MFGLLFTTTTTPLDSIPDPPPASNSPPDHDAYQWYRNIQEAIAVQTSLLQQN